MHSCTATPAELAYHRYPLTAILRRGTHTLLTQAVGRHCIAVKSENREIAMIGILEFDTLMWKDYG